MTRLMISCKSITIPALISVANLQVIPMVLQRSGLIPVASLEHLSNKTRFGLPKRVFSFVNRLNRSTEAVTDVVVASMHFVSVLPH